MSWFSKFRRGMAVARRMTLLTLLGVTLLGSWIYWHSPTLNELRPQIAIYLQKRFDLSTLHIGNLSWYWAGYLWLHADDLTFATRDGHIRLNHGHLAIRVSMLRLALGEWRPDGITLSNGQLSIDLVNGKHGTITSLIPQLFHQDFQIQETTLHWRRGIQHGVLPNMNLDIKASERRIILAWPGLQLNTELNEDMLPAHLEIELSNLAWLPPKFRQPFKGKFNATLKLSQADTNRWQCNLSAYSSSQAAIELKSGVMEIPFQKLKMQVQIFADHKGPVLNIKEIRVEPLQWTLGQNKAQLTAIWKNGVLSAKGYSEHLDMPILWSWLRPLGGSGWHDWLAKMQHGIATNVDTILSLPWSNPAQGFPVPLERKNLQYRISANVKDADIALGKSGDALTNTYAKVDLDNTGLKATISNAELPKGIGSIHGTLLIPWSSLTLNIQGDAQIGNVASLIRWKRPHSPAADWFTNAAQANGTFALLWNPDEDTPRSATATLSPNGIWALRIGGLGIAADNGLVHWSLNQGLKIDQVHVATKILEGTLSMDMTEDKLHHWTLHSLDSDMQGKMADLVDRFQLPIANPQGSFNLGLDFKNGWQGSVNLSGAGWDNVLGTQKAIGAPFSINITGQGGNRPGVGNIIITQLTGTSHKIRFDGNGLLAPDGLHLNFTSLKSPDFNGGVQVMAPFGDAPWEITVNAKFMSRAALPLKLQKEKATFLSKPWALHAQIARFDWSAATIFQANLQLASSSSSIGVFDAKKVITGGIQIKNVHALFALPGAGAIDLRQCTGRVNKENIELSAEMTPDKGRMNWKGYTYVSGDFGQLLRRAGISKRFLHGNMRLLFAGQGIFSKKRPWWQGLYGRLRLRVDNGRVLEGGTLNKLLAAMNLADLPKLLIGQRAGLTGPGMLYNRLQMETTIQGQKMELHQIALRSPAMDIAGNGVMHLNTDRINIILVARPFQNLDAILSKIPVLRDFLGGGSYSLMRQVYWMHGPFTDATVERISAKKAGLAPAGLIESLLTLPEQWFGKNVPAKNLKLPKLSH